MRTKILFSLLVFLLIGFFMSQTVFATTMTINKPLYSGDNEVRNHPSHTWVIYFSNPYTGQLNAALMDGFDLKEEVALDPLPSPNWRIAATYDINGNGSPDLILQNIFGRMAVRYMDNYNTVSVVPINPEFTNSNIQIAGIYEGDLFFQNIFYGGRFAWIMNGVNQLNGYRLDAVNVAWKIAVVDDMNNDGNANFIFEKTSGERSCWTLNENYFKVYGEPFYATGPSWQILGACDMTGDGHTDLLLHNKDDQRIAFWIMEGLNRVGEQQLFTVNPPWAISGNYSFNGTGVIRHTVNINASPAGGGTYTGDGVYNDGDIVTARATINPGYNFNYWTENDKVVSTNPNYTFTITEDRNLKAHFYKLYADVKIVPDDEENNIIYVSLDGSQVSFSNTTPFVQSLQVGDVIVSDYSTLTAADGDPDTIISRITGILPDGKTMMVQEAMLDEVIEEGELVYTSKIGFAQLLRSLQEDEEITVLGYDQSSMTIDFEYEWKYDEDDYEGKDIKIKVKLTLESDFEIDGSMSFWRGLEHFDFIWENGLKIELDCTASLYDASGDDKQSEFLKPVKEKIFWHVWGPRIWVFKGVYITPKVEFLVGFGGEVGVTINTGFTYDIGSRIGMKYRKYSGWERVYETTGDGFNFKPLTLEGKAVLNAYTGVRISGLAYSSAGVTVGFYPYLRGEIEAKLNYADPANWTWEYMFSRGIRGNFYAELKFWRIASMKYELLGDNFFIYPICYGASGRVYITEDGDKKGVPGIPIKLLADEEVATGYWEDVTSGNEGYWMAHLLRGPGTAEAKPEPKLGTGYLIEPAIVTLEEKTSSADFELFEVTLAITPDKLEGAVGGEEYAFRFHAEGLQPEGLKEPVNTVTFTWDMGDGTKGREDVDVESGEAEWEVIHAYPEDETEPHYEIRVELINTDTSELITFAICEVTFDHTATIIVDPDVLEEGDSGEEYTFNVKVTDLPEGFEGTDITLTYNFGDGSGDNSISLPVAGGVAETDISHTYQSGRTPPAPYVITLKATGQGSGLQNVTELAEEEVLAYIDMLKLEVAPGKIENGVIDKEYTFSARAERIDGSVVSIYFYFSDRDNHAHLTEPASTAFDAEVELPYMFREEGQYTITVTAEDNSRVLTKYVEVEIGESPSVTIVGGGVTHKLGEDEEEYIHTFTAQATPPGEYRYEWDFDDGSSATDIKPEGENSVVSHGYKEGVYEASVQLFDPVSGDFLASDSVSIIVASEFRDYDLDECNKWLAASSGGVLGTHDIWDISMLPVGTTFDIQFNAHSMPDRFVIQYGGVMVLDTGWRGDASRINEDNAHLYPGGISGPGYGIEESVFTKTAHNSFTVTVYAPEDGTWWDYSMRAICSAPPEASVRLLDELFEANESYIRRARIIDKELVLQ